MTLPNFEDTGSLALFLKSLPRQLSEEEVHRREAEHDVDDYSPAERLGVPLEVA